MNESILFKHGVIVDAINRSPFIGDIRIEAREIAEIALAVRPRRRDRVVDMTGKYLMPGLVDLHVHVSHCWADSLSA